VGASDGQDTPGDLGHWFDTGLAYLNNARMRISRRSSGGRGEYEISESTPEGVTPTDVLDHRLILDFGGGLVVDTNSTLRHQGGKFRIRLLGVGTIHPHRQVAAALMMPRPVREDVNWGRGAPVMRADQYAVEHIQILGAHVAPADVRNASYAADELKLVERLTQVRAVWENAARFPQNVSELIQRHQTLVTGGGPVSRDAEEIVSEIQKIITEAREDFGIEYRSQTEDVVGDLLKSLAWADVPPAQPEPIDAIPPEELEIRRRVLKDWKRWVNYRGAKSATFRQEVRRAYNSTCIVCGLNLPPTPFNAIAGVEAAHILPWAEYDLDEVSNGLCLCKNHHWAFDEGLILITYDGQQYQVEVPPDVVAEIQQHSAQFSINELLSLAGPIPAARLPAIAAERPRPQFLRLLAEKLRSDGA
jgi:putative restriction endonuclease